jgi:hypothetical protein
MELNFGKGNGDYEVIKDLYDLVPDRLPVDKNLSKLVTNLVDSLVYLIDIVYKNKPYQRFYVLETIARVPYFSYIFCLFYL